MQHLAALKFLFQVDILVGGNKIADEIRFAKDGMRMRDPILVVSASFSHPHNTAPSKNFFDIHQAAH
jgi:hypothetical protein